MTTASGAYRLPATQAGAFPRARETGRALNPTPHEATLTPTVLYLTEAASRAAAIPGAVLRRVTLGRPGTYRPPLPRWRCGCGAEFGGTVLTSWAWRTLHVLTLHPTGTHRIAWTPWRMMR